MSSSEATEVAQALWVRVEEAAKLMPADAWAGIGVQPPLEVVHALAAQLGMQLERIGQPFESPIKSGEWTQVVGLRVTVGHAAVSVLASHPVEKPS